MSDLITRLRAVEGTNEGTHWYRNPDGPDAAQRIKSLELALFRLSNAIRDYMIAHDTHGDAHLRAGRAWDHMRRERNDAMRVLQSF